MAFDIYDNAYFSYNTNNLSAYIESIELSAERELQDDTTMGDTTRSNIAGLKNWTFTVNFKQDVAASALDSIIWPLFDAGATHALEFRTDAGSASASNPKWTGNGLISQYTPATGSVGDVKMASMTVVPAKGSGSAALTRATL